MEHTYIVCFVEKLSPPPNQRKSSRESTTHPSVHGNKIIASLEAADKHAKTVVAAPIQFILLTITIVLIRRTIINSSLNELRTANVYGNFNLMADCSRRVPATLKIR